jgi:hypothetical protein
MKYSNYFGSITKQNGQPNLDTKQFRRMMNIVSVEGVIHGLRIIKEKYSNTSAYFKFDVDIFKHQRVLTDLSGNLNPDELIKEMYRLSRD